jgi:hypothetical protein
MRVAFLTAVGRAAGCEPCRGCAAAVGAGLDQPGQLRAAAKGTQHSTSCTAGGNWGCLAVEVVAAAAGDGMACIGLVFIVRLGCLSC